MPVSLDSTFLEYPDNNSIATIVYMSGCNKHCEGCHNKDLQMWEEHGNSDYIIEGIKDYSKHLDTRKIVICGGDPLYWQNIPLTKKILQKLGEKFDICIYTGRLVQEVENLGLEGFKFIKCGKFDRNTYRPPIKTDKKMVLSSANQEFYDSNYNRLSKNGILYF